MSQEYGMVKEPGMGGMVEGIGQKLQVVGDQAREILPDGGRVGDVVDTLTEGVESCGAYLRERGVTGAVEDLEGLIRRYPVYALVFGLGLGFVLSRARGR